MNNNDICREIQGKMGELFICSHHRDDHPIRPAGERKGDNQGLPKTGRSGTATNRKLRQAAERGNQPTKSGIAGTRGWSRERMEPAQVTPGQPLGKCDGQNGPETGKKR